MNISSLTSLITLTDIEQLIYNGTIDDADSLTVNAVNAVIVLRPTSATASSIRSTRRQCAVEPTYLHVPTVSVNGTTTAVIQGTSENDTITVSATGIVTVTNLLGFNNSVNVSAFANLVINALGGDDSITIQSSALFSGGIRVIGGEPGASDSVSVTDPNPILNFNDAVLIGQTTLRQVVGGPISLVGVETVNVNGAAGTDAVTVLNYGFATDVKTVNLQNFAGDTTDTIAVTGASGPGTFRYTSLTGSAARLERLDGGPVVNISGFNSTDNNLTLAGGGNIKALQVIAPASNDLTAVIQTCRRRPHQGDGHRQRRSRRRRRWVPIRSPQSIAGHRRRRRQ